MHLAIWLFGTNRFTNLKEFLPCEEIRHGKTYRTVQDAIFKNNHLSKNNEAWRSFLNLPNFRNGISRKTRVWKRWTLASKVIIHKSRGEQFSWNRYWDLGWFWAGMQCWKKNWADFEQFLRAVFSCFHRQRKCFFFKYCCVCTKTDNFF